MHGQSRTEENRQIRRRIQVERRETELASGALIKDIEETLCDTKRMKHSLAVFGLLFCAYVAANAQNLPPPSRTVYKCEDKGKTHYSDAPCLGAQKIDVEPTRGLNRTSGKERVGNDVQRERHREMFAEAFRPLTGMDARQLDHSGRRMKLHPEQQRACRQLDSRLPAAEHAERNARNAAELQSAQLELFKLRKAYREGSCE